jgi:hypothetical protein
MVDRPARDRLAEKLRHFVAGQITVGDFWGALSPHSADAGVHAVWWFGDAIYNEFGTPRMRGRFAARPEDKREAVRAIVFLHSDFEYEWPPFPSGCVSAVWLYGTGTGLAILVFALLSAVRAGNDGTAAPFAILAAPLLVTAGLAYLASRWDEKRFEQRGDFEVWPFLRRTDLAEAVKRPRLLAGRSR